jgi:hypothetical protein
MVVKHFTGIEALTIDIQVRDPDVFSNYGFQNYLSKGSSNKAIAKA